MNTEQMAAHIARVCKIEDITVGRHSHGGRAYRRRRHVNIRPVKSAVTYAIALHEIGHILGPRQSSTRLDQEVGAWEWAQANAIGWSDAMTKTMQKGLRSYLLWSLRRRGVRRAEPGHPIYAMAGFEIKVSVKIV